jgi:hypothetical protein
MPSHPFMRVAVTAFTLGAFTACAASQDAAQQASAALSSEETAQLQGGASGVSAVTQALEASEDLFALGEDLLASVTVDVNAQRMQAAVTARLDGCGAVTVSGATVTVVFAEVGCTVEGVNLQGTISATVASVSPVTVDLRFTRTTIAGVPLEGTARVVVVDSTHLTVDPDVTSGDYRVTGSVTVTHERVDSVHVELTGTLNVTEGSLTTSYALEAVGYDLGDCYPSSGAAVSNQGRGITLLFGEETRHAGVVTITRGNRSIQETLPAYGSCPSESGNGQLLALPDGGVRPMRDGGRR